MLQRSQLLLTTYIIIAVIRGSNCEITRNTRLQVITVATEENDGYQRFMTSAEKYGYSVKTLGMGMEWKGGDVARFAGGGQKVRLLRKAMQEFKDEEDLIVLFVDSYDVVMTNDSTEFINRFMQMKANIIFSAEAFCWPDNSLAEYYPTVKVNEKRYLNSGGFVGYAKYINQMLQDADLIKDQDDDQLYYTKIFLNEKQRGELTIALDSRSFLFQNLNGAMDDVSIRFENNKVFLYNTAADTTPIVIHGNGPIKVEFNSLTNYIPDQWSPESGCLTCAENRITLDIQQYEYPTVFLAVFIEHPTGFLEEFLENLEKLTYPKRRIDLFIHNVEPRHSEQLEEFLQRIKKENYRSLFVKDYTTGLKEGQARQLAMQECIRQESDYFFSLDGDVQLTDFNIIQNLIQRNKSIIAPLLTRPGKLWSNFWGALNKDGYYRRSEDYVDIVDLKRTGLWNVPYINSAYLIKSKHLSAVVNDPDLPLMGSDSDIVICRNFREKTIFMYVDNLQYYGFLIDSENLETVRHRPDLYMIFDNKEMWERKYLNKEYHKTLHEAAFQDLQQPCPDVFWLPLVSRKFCRDLIDEMENYGQWSGGRHEDNRLAGGYENVPTVDIHTNQIGWERHWLHILKEYIAPLVTKAFAGYYPESKAIMNFVVRYRPGEQDFLRPHSDSSTYSVNIALNSPHIDYEGGGTRFLRYNCSVTESRIGWMLIHPGRVTHHHEGLKTTKGTRYIMVSFVDP